MPKPVCVKCERFMRPKHNGLAWIEGMPAHEGALVGKPGEGQWRPYKLWLGDLWWCPDCETEIIIGNGHVAVSEHFEDNFCQATEALGAKLMIKDC